MLKNKLKTSLILFLSILLIASISFATVEPRTTEEDASLTSEAEEEEEDLSGLYDNSGWVNNDLFICEDNVVIDQVVDGNAFVIGKNVTITGEIGGDLFVVADKLTINDGYVYSSIFACANELQINGIVYDVYAFCNNFTLGEDGFVYRDLKVSAEMINLSGKVKRDAYLTASTYNINADSTRIEGKLQYNAKEDITIAEGVVSGEVTRVEPKENVKTESIGNLIVSYISDLVKTLLYTFVVVLLLLWLAPKFVNRLGQMSIAKDFTCLGIGLAAFAAVVVGGFILIMTVIGIPLFFSVLLLLAILASISFSITSIFFGKLFSKLLKLEGNVKFVLITLASSLVLWILSQIPVLGTIVTILVTLFGVGAIIVNVVSKKEAKISEETK